MFNKACKKPLIKGLFIFKNILSVFIALWGFFFFAQTATAQTKSLKLYYVHTGEKIDVVFKKNGKYISSGLKQLNYFLRDWRRNEPTKMDPRLFDLVWQVYQNSGSRNYIHVISAYRSPITNNMLRSRSINTGVAKNSQHTLGRAMDFYIPDVKLSKIRQIGLRQQVGGVGYYPTSGSPFVHLDVGNVRHWPRISRSELLALFPNGKTMYIPSDGKPLSNYTQAMAEFKARRGYPAKTTATGNEEKSVGLFARLFGNKKEAQKQEKIVNAARQKNTQPPPIVPVEAEQDAIDDMFDLPNSNNAPIPIASPTYNQDTDVVATATTTPVENKDDINALIAQNNPMPIPQLKPHSNVAAANQIQKTPTSADQIENEINKNNEVEKQATPSSNTTLAYSIPVPIVRNQHSKVIDNSNQNTTELLSTRTEGETRTDNINKIIDNNSDIIPLPQEDYNDNYNKRIQPENMKPKDNIDRNIAVASITTTKDQATHNIVNPNNNSTLLNRNNTDNNEMAKELLKIPTIVFSSSLKKGKVMSDKAKLTGRAINFQAISYINR